MEPETWKFDIDSSNLLKRKDTDRNEITEGEREKKICNTANEATWTY